MSDRSTDIRAARLPWETIGEAEDELEASESVLSEEHLHELRSAASAFEPIFLEMSEKRQEEVGVPDPQVRVGGGGWTLPLLCAGIALIACCMLIPQADANRRLAYERQMLKMDLQTVDRQIAVNAEFLKKVASDPTLAERLAERQMKFIPEGTRVLELKHETDGSGMSPFQLVSVAPPPPPPPYKPIGGVIANLCYDPHGRLYLIGASLCMIAIGLVLGYAPQPSA